MPHTNDQSGNTVTVGYGLECPVKYAEIFDNGWIVEVTELDEMFVGKLYKVGDIPTVFDDNASIADALSCIAEYLESIGVIWSFENYSF